MTESFKRDIASSSYMYNVECQDYGLIAECVDYETAKDIVREHIRERFDPYQENDYEEWYRYIVLHSPDLPYNINFRQKGKPKL